MHVSATAFGGGVSEILYTLVPLMSDVGLDVEWQVIYGREEFFNATKLMHNALQGAPEDLSRRAVGRPGGVQRDERARARRAAGTCALVHDPQPAALHTLVPEKARGWVWRCHIDLSTPNPATIDRLLPYIASLPAVALPHARATCPTGWTARVNIVPAGDRPAGAEEHGAVARGRGLRLRAVRHRRRPAR